jgi:hypothetical protein
MRIFMYTYINIMVLILNMSSEVVIMSQYLDIDIDYALLSSELYWSRKDLTFWYKRRNRSSHYVCVICLLESNMAKFNRKSQFLSVSQNEIYNEIFILRQLSFVL